MPGTAQASPNPPTARSASTRRAPPVPNATGWPKATATESSPAPRRPGDLASALAVLDGELNYFSTESVEPCGSRARTDDRWPDVVETAHDGLW